jgi:hypothetical protein
MTKYVIITAISSYRTRYVIPVDELQKLNTEVSVEGREIEWAKDCVTCNDVREFSQLHLGEQIIDGTILDEEVMLKQFDSDNEYLSGWAMDYKIGRIQDWKFK